MKLENEVCTQVMIHFRRVGYLQMIRPGGVYFHALQNPMSDQRISTRIGKQ
jgi:hypothetical protein